MTSPGADACILRRRAGHHGPDNCCTLGQVQRLDKGVARGAITYAKFPALDASGGYQLIGHVSHGIGGDGETDPLISARTCDDSRVDTDQFTAQVDQRPSGISRIDSCVRLNEVIRGRRPACGFVICHAVSYSNPACCADNTRRNGITERCFDRRSESHDPLSRP